MQQQLNTPEELRAIREAMDEGKNPLVATDVPRWEDQVGISRIVNRRVLEFEVLPTPAQVGPAAQRSGARDRRLFTR